ncbi:MAG TPA: TetR/AcrR family transcriptional regulator [Phycisphaerae bacterium]|nr:TetR/AcrR family transcriptional regulator [Phycisphaerae bacterium]HRY70922.1 TetR/AcrR family transcriptional regulator [Phycisphaerae bacterium]HSA27781.1 TetR/AcrR family transcriptional regulator [Phycisphaerae bacterium]
MANVKNNASSQETRRKLIDAAGKVFSERGLHAATLREITHLAGVNTASVNYHFNDKYELYRAVVRHAVGLTLRNLPAEQLTGSPENRLRAFIAHVIKDSHDPARPEWRTSLLSHELNQPTAAMEAVMDELIWPRVHFVNGLIRDILGPQATKEEVASGAFSVIAQIVHCLYNAGLLRRIEPKLVEPDNAETLAAHITEFSLAGLHAMRDQSRANARQRDDQAVERPPGK